MLTVKMINGSLASRLKAAAPVRIKTEKTATTGLKNVWFG
jgi:hypothetical protein